MRQVTNLDKWLFKPDEPTPEEIEIHHNEQHRLQREQLERKKARDAREKQQRAVKREKLRQNYYDQVRDKLLDYKDGKEPRIGPLVTFFDHLFLGPGNNYLKGKPFDSDDAISKVHDQDYALALTQEDIQLADKVFKEDAITDVLINQNWHSIVAWSGIALKNAVESVVGPVYPG